MWPDLFPRELAKLSPISFHDARNRAAFLAGEDGYFARCRLNAEQRDAVRRRDVVALLVAGGNIHHLARFAGVFVSTSRTSAHSRPGWTRRRARPCCPPASIEGDCHGPILGSISTSHVPAIDRAIVCCLQKDAYWAPFFDGWAPVRQWLAEQRPNVAVVFYNDHGLNFFLDTIPTFGIGAADRYTNADEAWGIAQVPLLQGDPALSWHLIEQLLAEEFDVTSCQEMLVDQAVTNPLQLMYPDMDWGVRLVPICINAVQFPLPSARGCWALGDAVGRAVRAWNRDDRVVVVASGGLSHRIDGARVGFINKTFDLEFLDSLATDPRWATKFDTTDLVEQAGSQGVELLM